MLHLHFYGAAGAVTGSCFLLESADARILVDCGMFQGSKTERELNYRHFPFRAAGISALCLTHAHIDHSGLVPKLVKAGFNGPVFATQATADLASIMLPDSGYIQEMEVERLNRRNRRRSRALVAPIYTQADAVACLSQFQAVAYGEWQAIAPGFRARYWNAGHLLGSASIEIEAIDGVGAPVRLLFSGDLGPDHKLLQPPAEGPRNLDYAIVESTYGDRDRLEIDVRGRRERLRDEVLAATRPSGALLIPSFAVERTQELLVDLRELMRTGEIPDTPVFIDSPLATRATAIFKQHAAELDQGEDLVRALESRWVRFTESVEESKDIGRVSSFHIIIAASGMCEAGRIRHHLKAWLWRQDATILFVGFQAQGTLGRILQDGVSRVRLWGDDINVRARIRTLDLYSGHADAPELKSWLEDRLPIRRGVFLVHGEMPALEALKKSFADVVPRHLTHVPNLDDIYDLAGERAALVEDRQQRLPPMSTGHRDWHNDLSQLLLDLDAALDQAADRNAKEIIIRRMRRALETERH